MLVKQLNIKLKNKKGVFLGILLGNLGASLLGNLLTGKGTIRAGEDTIRSAESTTSWSGFLMLPHPLANFEIQKYCQNEPKFYGLYSRNNLLKIKDEAYVVNLAEYESTGTL